MENPKNKYQLITALAFSIMLSWIIAYAISVYLNEKIKNKPPPYFKEDRAEIYY